ncbi:MAG: tryptophan 7-halogenase, partial [bacterium]|nr:tryptophan 7-halogenase [bacterium]
WFWVIPLSQGIDSVGIVVQPERFFQARGKTKGRESLFAQAIASCPMIAEMLRGARRVEAFRACSDFSKNAEQYFRPGLFIVGDAACFIDPILSTGIHLAMRGGLLAGLAANTVLRGGDESRAMRAFDDLYRREYEPLLRVSQLQYDMNRDRDDRFWLAHRILEPDLQTQDQQADRNAFIRLVAGMGAVDPGRSISAHRVHQVERFRRRGLGRYDQTEFEAEALSLAKAPLSLAPGYREGARRRLTLASTRMIESGTNQWYAVGAWDTRLLRLCDGRRPVREILAELSTTYPIKRAERTVLRRMLGYWVDRQVLVRPTV